MDDSKEQSRSSIEVGIGLLGGVPHTVRGSLWSYDSRLTVTHRFPSCTACSEPIVAEYRKRGCDFVLDSCNQPNYLERLSGLEEMLKGSELDEVRAIVYYCLQLPTIAYNCLLSRTVAYCRVLSADGISRFFPGTGKLLSGRMAVIGGLFPDPPSCPAPPTLRAFLS
jgi:hypothetical protein